MGFGKRQRMRCKKCERRATLKRIHQDDGSTIVQCLSCGGEHTLRRAARELKQGDVCAKCKKKNPLPTGHCPFCCPYCHTKGLRAVKK